MQRFSLKSLLRIIYKNWIKINFQFNYEYISLISFVVFQLRASLDVCKIFIFFLISFFWTSVEFLNPEHAEYFK
jgi:hypothetical protein